MRTRSPSTTTLLAHARDSTLLARDAAPAKSAGPGARSTPPPTSPLSFIKDLRERRIARHVVTYCVVGWAVLQVVDQVVDRSVLPNIVYRVFLTAFLSGLPGALIVSWFHGAKGRQHVSALEGWLLGCAGIFAIATTGWVARSGPAEGGSVPISPEQDPSRVAVLYFDSRGGGEDLELLASGLTEGLIEELSTVDALTVVSRNGSEMFKNSAATSDSIGRALEVGTLVDGVVAESDGQIRLTVTLIDAFTGREIKSTPIQRPREDLFVLQDSLAHQVSLLLRQAIGEEVGEVRARSGTRVVKAWELLQRAEEAEDQADERLARGDVAGASQALVGVDSLMGLAREADPGWSEPLVRRGWVAYRQARLGGMDRSHYLRWLDVGMEHAEEALSEDPRNADALELRATLQYWRYLLNLAGDPAESARLLAEAEEGLRAAIVANPRQASALTSLSHLLLRRGDVSEAKLKAEESYEADPFLENANLTLWRLVLTSFELGDDIELQRHCQEGLERFPDDYRFHECKLRWFAMSGRAEDVPAAWSDLEGFVERTPQQLQEGGQKRGLMYIAMGLARLAREGAVTFADSARSVALQGRAGVEVDPLRELALWESIVRTWLGEYDEAVRLLGTYVAANPTVREAYRVAAQNGTLRWYLADLGNQAAFRRMVGIE